MTRPCRKTRQREARGGQRHRRAHARPDRDRFAKGGGAGRLFGSVTTQEIADALKQSCGIELDRRKLVLDEPIKTTGIYTVRCKLGYEITADLRVEIKEQ